MKYYILKQSIDLKEIGKAGMPQIEGIYEHHVDNPDYIFNAFKDHKKVDRNVLIPKARLRLKSTKITDILSGWGHGFTGRLLISDTLKNIIEKSKQHGVQFFYTTVFDFSGEKQFSYWLANVYIFFPEYIDYPKCEIWVATIDGKDKERVHVVSYTDFQQKSNQYAPREFEISKVALLENQIEYDFFALDKMPGVVSYFVSERLKNEIEKNACTGIEFISISVNEL
jgi:hypothetical protein